MTGEAAVRLNKYSEVRESIYGKHVRSSDMLLTGLIYGCTAVSLLILVGILGYTFVRGIPHVTWSFLSTASSAVKGTFGILGNIINTIYIVVITLLIATPIGVGSAVYLNEYAKPGKIVRMIEFTTETLSGIPSIIFGLFGMVFFGNTIGLGYSILTGSLTLTLMILPLITRTTQEALKTVPDSYRHGALGSELPMVHDPYDSSSQRYAGYCYGRDPGYRTYCRRICGSFIHCRKRLLSAQKYSWQDF